MSKGSTILIVDDDASFCDVLTDILEEAGYSVLSCPEIGCHFFLLFFLSGEIMSPFQG
ncbi:hypothetical protein J7K93_00595 [bacterium]|nr:hypothetical protein [bacterium]